MTKFGVIFDVDGVLIDSYQAHFESWRRLYGEVGLDYTEAAFAADFGRTSRDILRRTLGDDLTDERVRELDGKKEAYFREIIHDDFPAMPGVSELLDALAAAGFGIAIGSSGPPENIAVVLAKLPGAQQIAAAVTGADVTRGKPDPQVFQIAAERLKLPPANCAVVEDAQHGVEAAKRAGMAGIALIGTLEREAFSMADLVVDRLDELSPNRIEELIRQVAR